MEKRGLFQFHLSTIVLVTLVGGVMMGLNFREPVLTVKPPKDPIFSSVRITANFSRVRVTIPGFPFSSDIDFGEYGEPGDVNYYVNTDSYKNEKRNVMVVNIPLNVTALLIIAFLFDRVAFPRAKPESQSAVS
jgi:hypothetical protein